MEQMASTHFMIHLTEIILRIGHYLPVTHLLFNTLFAFNGRIIPALPTNIPHFLRLPSVIGDLILSILVNIIVPLPTIRGNQSFHGNSFVESGNRLAICPLDLLSPPPPQKNHCDNPADPPLATSILVLPPLSACTSRHNINIYVARLASKTSTPSVFRYASRNHRRDAYTTFTQLLPVKFARGMAIRPRATPFPPSNTHFEPPKEGNTTSVKPLSSESPSLHTKVKTDLPSAVSNAI